MSKYIKWKLLCDLVLCQVSRDKEDEKREEKEEGQRGRENRRKGIIAERDRERVCEGQNKGDVREKGTEE